MTATRLVLASASPRRRELLGQLGLRFDVVPADIDESPRAGEEPRDYVLRLAREKAAAVAADDAVVIAADTTVAIDGLILGKPADLDDAREMLRSLAGREHDVHTGVAVRVRERTAIAVETTRVTFAPLDASAIEWYLSTGEPFDKAGAYAIQGAGGALVERIDGSASNVVGLPLTLVVALARELGVRLLGS